MVGRTRGRLELSLVLKVITLNVNGIRSAERKGLFRWLPAQKADVICLQETKAQEADLKDGPFHIKGYERHLHSAEKKGYAGVALYCKRKPDAVVKGFGNERNARDFIAFVQSETGRKILAKYGFLKP